MRIWLLISAVLSFCFFSRFAKSDCQEEFLLGTAPVPPLVSVINGKIDGYIGKKAGTLIDAKGLSIKTLSINWSRALLMANNGEIDALFPTIYSEERAAYLDFGVPAIGAIRTSLYKTDDNHNPPPISESVIGTMRSLEYDKSLLKGADIFEVSDFKQLPPMLDKHRVDYIFGVKEIIDHHISKMPSTTIVEHKQIGVQPVYIALSKNSVRYTSLKRCLTSP